MNNSKGFTLVEIMIVVGIIGILAVIAIPYYLRSRVQSTAKACVNNLRILEDARAQYAIENKKTGNDIYNIDDLQAYVRIPNFVHCPSTDDDYVIGTAKQSSGKISEEVMCPNYDPVNPEFSTHKLGNI